MAYSSAFVKDETVSWGMQYGKWEYINIRKQPPSLSTNTYNGEPLALAWVTKLRITMSLKQKFQDQNNVGEIKVRS